MSARPRPREIVLRPCGCRFGASDGFYEHVVELTWKCDCCGKVEDLVAIDRTPPRLPGRPKPRPDVVRVCADCLRDWKGIERKDAER